MGLWERAEALERLERLLGDGGRIAVVAGEAGIGKSALVGEFARRAERRARVLWGACDQLSTPRVLGPVHDIGRQAGGALARAVAEGAQEPVLQALLDELTVPRQAVRPVVVVEDAHWADEATLDLLVLLGRRVPRLPALLVLTLRDDELAADHPLRAALAKLPAAATTRIVLPPLSAECVADQARRAGQDPDTVTRFCGGNPLLVTEFLRDRAPHGPPEPEGGDGPGPWSGAQRGARVPEAVRDLVLGRLRGLAADERELAHLAAVSPGRLAPGVAAGRPVDACVDAGILVHVPDGVAYRHELLRSAVEEALSPARAREMHRVVLDRLTAGAEPGVDPGRLVHHAIGAGDAAAVMRWGRVAGDAAARQGARREAASYYRAAAEHAELLPEPERADLLEVYRERAFLAGRFVEGLAAGRKALALRERRGERLKVGENLYRISRMTWWAGDGPGARAAAVRAVEVLADTDGPELAMAYGTRAHMDMLAHQNDDAIDWGVRALELAGRLGDRETAIQAQVTVHTARLQDGHLPARGPLEEVFEHAVELGFVDAAARVRVNLAFCMDELARYPDAAEQVEKALAYAEQEQVDGYLQCLLGVRAGIRFARCDWDGALQDAEASLSRPFKVGVALVPSLIAKGRIQSARGEDAALETLTKALRLAETAEEFQWLAPALAARSEYFLWAGDPRRAAEEARRGLRTAPGTPFKAGELAYRLWRADGTATVLPTGHPYQLMIEGDWRGASAEWQARTAEFARAEALAAGDEEAAHEALRLLDALGAVAAASHLRAELRRRGHTRIPRGPRRATAARSDGLTPRQADVLSLVAEGLTNAEIAVRLTLSPKTVDHHISAILGKLGVTSRGQAAARVRAT
ncbi:ATP-binding protein [Actinocorallia longicatena]|uniref:ATP-binding protein n=1 Tax=Actinocorallia longicatena TaxID=111803 RepID=UPI0031DEE22C